MQKEKPDSDAESGPGSDDCGHAADRRGLGGCGGGGRGVHGAGGAQNEAAAEEMPETKHNKPGAYISFENVSKSFGEFDVLKDVSFCVNPGETLCILGRSGVGKSVSLQMLLGF